MRPYIDVACVQLQWRSQTLEKVTHTKGRLLDQAVILSNCVPFYNGNSSLWIEYAHRGNECFPLRAVPYGVENLFYYIRWPPLNFTIFITRVCNCIVCACAILKDRPVRYMRRNAPCGDRCHYPLPVCYGTSRLKSRVCAVTRCTLLKTPTLKSNKR